MIAAEQDNRPLALLVMHFMFGEADSDVASSDLDDVLVTLIEKDKVKAASLVLSEYFLPVGSAAKLSEGDELMQKARSDEMRALLQHAIETVAAREQ